MKNCLVCKKEIEKNEKVCHSCVGFFKYKYCDNWEIEVDRFLNALEKNENSLGAIKSNRRYKNE